MRFSRAGRVFFQTARRLFSDAESSPRRPRASLSAARRRAKAKRRETKRKSFPDSQTSAARDFRPTPKPEYKAAAVESACSAARIRSGDADIRPKFPDFPASPCRKALSELSPSDETQSEKHRRRLSIRRP